MESTEKDIVIEKIKEMPEEQVEKVMIFMAGLEAGRKIDMTLKLEMDDEIYI